MYHLRSTLRIKPDDPRGDRLQERLLKIACESFGLCASVGCACDGGEGEVLCSEVVHGTRYRIAVSEGPTWMVMVSRLPAAVTFDLFFDEDSKPSALSRVTFREALAEIDIPATWMESTDHYSQEMLDAINQG